MWLVAAFGQESTVIWQQAWAYSKESLLSGKFQLDHFWQFISISQISLYRHKTNYLSTVMERLYIQKLPELQTEEGDADHITQCQF